MQAADLAFVQWFSPNPSFAVRSAAAETQLQCGAAQQGLLVKVMVLVEAENSWTQGHSWNLCVPECGSAAVQGSAGSCWIRTLSICCGEEGGRV